MSGAKPTGRVILVGAGPGDPDLITRRGAAALGRADAVVHDALVSTDLLALAPPEAERIDVGKRGHEAPTRPQAEISALLVRLAREGKRVVRLKGGDPFIFGRGGEEATACAEAGIPFEVVPGISSGVGALAYAGIPITDRRHGASFAVVSGHKDPTKVSEQTRWNALGTAADTLVVLMGMRNLEDIVASILAGGRAPDTPAAVVMNGTLPTQRVVEAPLAELPARAREAGLHAPAVVVIGDVVRLRKQLAWHEHRPLFGKRVLVTRAEDQAGELMLALVAAGAEAVHVPLIQLVPASDDGKLAEALARLDDYDALFFTSANAVRFFAAQARLPVRLAAQVVCVGPQTAAAAARAGLPVHLVPKDRFDAEGMLAEIEQYLAPAGRRFLLPRAEGARELLPEALRAAGAQVDAITVYRNVPAKVDAAALRAQLVAGGLDALTFTSPSTVRNFAALLDAPARRAARRCLIAAIGPVTAEALRHEKLAPDVCSVQADAAALVEALAEAAAGAGSGGEA